MNDPLSELTNRNQAELNPLDKFRDWLKSAEAAEPNDPTAMSVSSIDLGGMPNVRIVLMRRFDERGFSFFTNLESQKGNELRENARVAACFHWKSLRKQVRMRGEVEVVGDEEADEYFYSRPRGSQIASSASRQSRPLGSREQLLDEVSALTEKLGDEPAQRPAHWSGFRIKPLSIEFWSDGEFRLHDRLRFDRDGFDSDWELVRLYP